MAAIRPARFTRQPQNVPRINRGNQLGARILEHIPLNGNIRAVVSGNQGTRGSGGAFTSSPKGMGLRGTGSAARGSIPLDLSTKTKITIAFWLYWDNAANDDALAMELGQSYGFANGFIVDPNCSSPAAFMYGTGSPAGGSNLVTFPRPSAGAWHRVVLTMDRLASAGAVGQAYVDGIAQTMSAFPGANTTTGTFTPDTLNLMSRNGTSLFATGNLQDLTFYDGLLTNAQALEDYRNNWQAFHGPQTRLYFDTPAGADITGSASSSEGADTLAASGTLSFATITGSSAVSEGIDTLSASGSSGFAAITGTLSRSEGADTLVSAGALGNAITGAANIFEGSDTAAAAGTISNPIIVGTFARSEGSDTLSGAGIVTLPAITGSLAKAETADFLLAYGGFASDKPQLSIVTIMRKSTVNIVAPLTNQINTIAKLL